MQSSGKRRAIIRNNVVVAGSVWDTRIKMDEVEGGVKVFNGARNGTRDEEGMRVYRRLRRNQTEIKRRNWKPPEPVQLRKAKSDLSAPPQIAAEDAPHKFDDKSNDDDDDDEEIDIEVDDKEIDVPVEKPAAVETIPAADLKNEEADEIAKEEVLENSTTMQTHSRMQNIVDLVMWRDVSRSAFVFGFGIFVLCSSSYTKDLNFSLVSAVSYLGLVYLAVIFLYKSILRRGSVEFEDGECVIGEEEAIWVLRFLLPYVNEVMVKIRALFSGDPATTMKLALLLFVLARCGGTITTWTLAKLVFFGVFTIPKIFSSYSVQLAKYGKFWLQRFRDGWESCAHKKAAVAAVFTLIWNFSSTVARIWSVFMLVVAVKLYQQCVLEEQWNCEEDAIANTTTKDIEKEKECIREEEDSMVGRPAQHRQTRRAVAHVDGEVKAKKWT